LFTPEYDYILAEEKDSFRIHSAENVAGGVADSIFTGDQKSQ
jgi:hypothetical protein